MLLSGCLHRRRKDMNTPESFHSKNRSNLFVRYSSDDKGTDFSDKPGPGLNHIAILATGNRLNNPMKEDFDGLWREYVGTPGQNAEVYIDPVTKRWVINGVDTGIVALAHDTELAESYCHGQTGLRPNESEDNAMYYKLMAQSYAGIAEQAVTDIDTLRGEIDSQNTVIQEHIREATRLNDEMTGKVAHVDSVQEHVDSVKITIDGINTNLSNKYEIVVGDAETIANTKNEIITIKSTIEGYVGTTAQYASQVETNAGLAAGAASQVATDKGIIDGYKTIVVNQAAAVSEAYTYITTNTQMMTMSVDSNGHLVADVVNADLFSFSIQNNSNLIVTDTGDGYTADLGPITAYGYAVAEGYTGTKTEFAEELRDAASNKAASKQYKNEAKTWAQGAPADVSALGGTKSAKDFAEEAKSARDTIVDFSRESYVYGLVTDLTVAKTDALHASYRAVYDHFTREPVRVESFDRKPCHDWRRCLETFDANDNQILTYLHPYNSLKLTDGTNADLTGAHGDVMTRLPGMYSRKYRYTDASTQHPMEVMLFSTEPFFNSITEPGTKIGTVNGEPRDQLVGSFMGCHCDSTGAPKVTTNFGTSPSYATGDRLRSIIGCRPCSNIGGDKMHTMAVNNKMFLAHWETQRLIGDLMAVDFGTFNIQEAFSHGFNYLTTNNFRWYRKSGRSVNLGNGSGEIYADDSVISTITVNDVEFSRYPGSDAVAASGYGCGWKETNGTQVIYSHGWTVSVGDTVYTDAAGTTSFGTITALTAGGEDDDLVGCWNSTANSWANKPVVCSYCGIEYPWGGGQYLIGDGGFFYQNASDFADSYYLTCYDPAKFVTNFTHPTVPDGYERVYVRAKRSNGYIGPYDLNTRFAITPGNSADDYAGGDNKSLCDYWYCSSGAGQRGIRRGGNLTYGAIAGPFNVIVYYAFSSASVHLGCRAASYVR